MLGFIVWCVIFPVLTGIVLVVQYWANLLRNQDRYSREELVDFAAILPAQLDRLIGRQNRGTNILGIVSGAVAAWFLTLFGGLVSPDVTPSPDYAAGQIPNYFFQSILFPAILHLIWPSLREMAHDYGGGIVSRLVQAEVPFLFGMTLALAAVSLTVWGVYHEMSFFFCIINMVACMAYAGYRLDNPGEAEVDSIAEDFDREPVEPGGRGRMRDDESEREY